MTESTNYHIVSGSHSGIVKGVNLTSQIFNNIYGKIKENGSVICITQFDNKIFLGFSNGSVFFVTHENYEPRLFLKMPDNSASFNNLLIYDSKILAFTSKGLLKTMDDNGEFSENLLCAGEEMIIVQNFENKNFVATGGKENDLKLWDLNDLSFPIFSAKNVPENWLKLRVPIWITGILFTQKNGQLVTVTGYGQIRLYSTSKQRKPIKDIAFGDCPITAITATHTPLNVIVGNTKGDMALFDMNKGKLVHKYRDHAGAIKDISCHPSENLVAACGLDRFIRVYDIDGMQPLHKVYIKLQMSKILFTGEKILSDAKEQNPVKDKLNKTNHLKQMNSKIMKKKIK